MPTRRELAALFGLPLAAGLASQVLKINTSRSWTNVDEGEIVPLAAGTALPAPTGMTVGMTVDPTNFAEYAKYPGTRCSRIFSGPGSGLTSWSSTRITKLPTGVEPWISVKDYPSDAALVSWIKSATRPARFCWWHERDNDGGDHAARMDFFAKQRHLADVFRSVPDSKVRFMSPPQTLQWTAMASTSTKQKGDGDWRLWWPGSGEGATWDCYADSWRPQYPNPETFLRIPLEAAEGTGRPLYVAELGAARVSGDSSGTGRAAWIRDVATLLRERGCVYVAWWNDLGTGGTDFRLTDKPSADAWRAVIAANR